MVIIAILIVVGMFYGAYYYNEKMSRTAWKTKLLRKIRKRFIYFLHTQEGETFYVVYDKSTNQTHTITRRYLMDEWGFSNPPKCGWKIAGFRVCKDIMYTPFVGSMTAFSRYHANEERAHINRLLNKYKSEQ